MKFPSIVAKRDFETGQHAALRGVRLEDCPFRLAERILWWQSGFRDATYNNLQRVAQANAASASKHISQLRSQLNK